MLLQKEKNICNQAGTTWKDILKNNQDMRDNLLWEFPEFRDELITADQSFEENFE